ncbi:MAG: response regulator transcription factor [Chloroflexota bacterium]|jgi:DNA-binding NarL/FixJ family response regulator
MVRILIVHPTRLVCSLYASVFDDKPNMEVVAQATTINEAFKQIETCDCNIILVSVALPDNGALELTKEVAQKYPTIKVLVVGLPESKNAVLQYVMAGASGYVFQDVSVENLFKHIQAAQEDKALISPTMASAFMDHIAELAHISARPYLEPEAYTELTPRELEVLELIGQGLTNQEIADKLYIEVGTVKNHVHNILKKLDVSSREDAAAHLPFLKENEDEQAA